MLNYSMINTCLQICLYVDIEIVIVYYSLGKENKVSRFSVRDNYIIGTYTHWELFLISQALNI